MLASVAARVVASPATVTAATRFTGTAIARGYVQRTVADIASIAEARAFEDKGGAPADAAARLEELGA